MEQNATNQKTTRVGYVASDATTKTFESGKKVTNVTILSGSGESKTATYVRGWNAMADRLADIKTGQKWEFKGDLKVETKGDKSFDVMTAREAYPHLRKEIQGEVKHISDKKLGKTDMKNIMVVSSEMEGGKEASNVYNIELYGKKNMDKAKGIKVGDIVSTKGHVRMYDYKKDGELKVNRSFQNPIEIENHTAVSKEKKMAADKDIKLATSKAPKAKPKGKGVSMS